MADDSSYKRQHRPKRDRKAGPRIPPLDRCFYCMAHLLWEESVKVAGGIAHPECKEQAAKRKRHNQRSTDQYDYDDLL